MSFTQSEYREMRERTERARKPITAKAHNSPQIGESDLRHVPAALDTFNNMLGAMGFRAAERILEFTVKAVPMGAPRMTRCDRWKKRPAVVRYHAYRDAIREQVAKQNGGTLPATPDCAHFVFYIPMPNSWSAKKRKEMRGKPHRQKPDADNLFKGATDPLFGEDCQIWFGSQQKFWSDYGQINIKLNYKTNQ